MQQHLGRLAGVAKVDVSLADGRVVILAREDSQLEPALVFKAAYDSGVSVVEMTMNADGWIERSQNGSIVFRISGAQTFAVANNEISKAFETITGPVKAAVRARLYKKVGRSQPKSLGTIRVELIEVQRQ